MSDMYMLRSCDLGTFIAEHVQADTLFLGCCGEVINILVRHLHRAPGLLTPKEVLKSGSLGKGTAVKGSPVDIFERMKGASPTNIHEYSVSLAPIQLQIISSLPPKVKSLIQLIKYWKNTKLKGENEPEMPSFAEKRVGRPSWPNSYALEIIIINAWNDAGNPENFDMATALHSVLTSFVNHSTFKVILKQKKYRDDYLVPNRRMPYIMDPANPFNVMYHGLVGGKAFDLEKVVPEAQRWLSKPLFSGVKTSKQWI